MSVAVDTVLTVAAQVGAAAWFLWRQERAVRLAAKAAAAAEEVKRVEQLTIAILRLKVSDAKRLAAYSGDQADKDAVELAERLVREHEGNQQ